MKYTTKVHTQISYHLSEHVAASRNNKMHHKIRQQPNAAFMPIAAIRQICHNYYADGTKS